MSSVSQTGKLMRELLSEMKEMTILDNDITLNSSMKEDDADLMDSLADSIIESMK